MFFRIKPSGSRRYLQIAENRWENGASRQRIIATLGRLDKLQESGQLDALLASGARFAEKALVLLAHQKGEAPVISAQSVGPTLVFERLWQETGCQAILQKLLRSRRFTFPVERALFLTVLHRLLAPGSDRAAERWRVNYYIPGTEDLELHHWYRAMAWLGSTLPADQQQGSSNLVARCTKDLIEEQLFARRRDLFSQLEIVFFDTTSLYFEGQGGSTLGQYGHSKDHRPDERQMVVGAVLDGDGRPICCELWPGNTTDVKTLIPIIDRLWRRFNIRQICIVADRGMISQDTIADLEQQGWPYILGARMRTQKEVRDRVLADQGRFQEVRGPRKKQSDPAPLQVKEVVIEGRRYVVCLNEEEREHDAQARAAIIAGLQEQLRKGVKSLVGNKGYRRYLKVEAAGSFCIDTAKIEAEARYDGLFVLRTNTELATAEVALQYKRLSMVEHSFRTCKSLLQTRPIYHHLDETIRGHVFCSFLALLLKHELQTRLAAQDKPAEWAEVLRDLESVQYIRIAHQGKSYRLRSDLTGTASRSFQAAGVAVPATLELLAEPGA
jgi:hypothetical protein